MISFGISNAYSIQQVSDTSITVCFDEKNQLETSEWSKFEIHVVGKYGQGETMSASFPQPPMLSGGAKGGMFTLAASDAENMYYYIDAKRFEEPVDDIDGFIDAIAMEGAFK